MSVSKIHAKSWQHAYRGLLADSIIDNITVENRMKHWVKVIESGNPQLWVAVKDSALVGWIAFGPARDKDASPLTGEIEAIYIDPEYWRQGIGKNLVSKAVQVLSDEQFSRITLWVLYSNIRAANFYKAQGFEIDDCTPKVAERSGQLVEQIRYKLDIG